MKFHPIFVWVCILLVVAILVMTAYLVTSLEARDDLEGRSATLHGNRFVVTHAVEDRWRGVIRLTLEAPGVTLRASSDNPYLKIEP